MNYLLILFLVVFSFNFELFLFRFIIIVTLLLIFSFLLICIRFFDILLRNQFNFFFQKYIIFLQTLRFFKPKVFLLVRFVHLLIILMQFTLHFCKLFKYLLVQILSVLLISFYIFLFFILNSPVWWVKISFLHLFYNLIIQLYLFDIKYNLNLFFTSLFSQMSSSIFVLYYYIIELFIID